MSSIAKRLAKDFPGVYSVIDPSLRDRILRMDASYHFPPKEVVLLIEVAISMDDDEVEEFLDGVERAAQEDEKNKGN